MKMAYKLEQLSFFDGEVINTQFFKQQKELCKFLGVHRGTIRNVLKRGGFGGKYEDYNRLVKISLVLDEEFTKI